MKGRHALVRAALQDYWADLVAAFVVQSQRGAHQIGTRVAALGSGPVTKTAVGREDLLPSFDGRRIGNRPADEHVPARTRGWGRRGGLGGKENTGKEIQRC